MRPKHTSVAFLMEMLWVCGFFIIAACIFLIAFVKADQMSLRAQNLNQAVLYTENALEETFVSYPPQAKDREEIRYLYYDKNWKPTVQDASVADFVIKVSTSFEEQLLRASAEAFNRDGDSIYMLNGARYLPD